MNVISYTNNYYLDSAVRYLFPAEKEPPVEPGVDVRLANTQLNYIILFNDRTPAESLMSLSTYSGFKSDDFILVVSDVVPAEVVRCFIREKCSLVVQSGKVKVPEWFNFLHCSTAKRRKIFSPENTRKSLLTHAEKKFLNALKMHQTQSDFAKKTSIHRKTASAHKRSVMRKLGAHHTPQLLDYVNSSCFLQMLSHL